MESWLIDHGGIWGVISVCLGGVVLYLERERKRLEAEVRSERQARLEDTRLYARTVLGIAERFREAVNLVSRSRP
jgi:hypothetical protein